MKSRKIKGGYLLVFGQGEKLIGSLIEFCQAQKVQAGWLSGLGAIEAAEIGYYNLAKKAYHFVKLDSLLEIVSLVGNVAMFKAKPYLHIHTVLSDEGMKTYGGHLKEAAVGGTCEIHLTVFDSRLERQADVETGLNLLDV
ncbi:DNA-binding protein [Candidatus Microgenomates bacterium]|nr:DNA-binding protein [Candidatus Microgenomates bacterium]